MNILLDTNVFLWHIWGDNKLSLSGSKVIQDKQNQIYLSIASLWEIAIKSSIGKLQVNADISTLIPHEISILPIELSDLEIVSSLPFHHRDPFDRIIISQALRANLHLFTADRQITKYNDLNLIEL